MYEVTWDFQARVGNYCFELLGFKQNKKNQQFFKVSHFLASFELSTIFLSCQKVSKL